MKNMIAIWGHRGCRGSGNPPENSLQAFEAAIVQGADGVELDVLCSKDHELVVFHDDDLKRMTDGDGTVASRTLAELRALRLRDSSGKLTNATIPTLQDVLHALQSLCAQRRAVDFVVNIEIKTTQDPQVARLLVDTIVRERRRGGWKASSIQASSFGITVLRRIRASAPDIPVGVLLDGGKEPGDISEESLEYRLREVRDLEPESINITMPSLTPRAVKMIRSMNAIPVAWTCNEVHPDALSGPKRRALASTVLGSGIGCLITDYPGAMRKLLGSAR
jgi:glycerophosphoryl diester phosphodiesterase